MDTGAKSGNGITPSIASTSSSSSSKSILSTQSSSAHVGSTNSNSAGPISTLKPNTNASSNSTSGSTGRGGLYRGGGRGRAVAIGRAKDLVSNPNSKNVVIAGGKVGAIGNAGGASVAQKSNNNSLSVPGNARSLGGASSASNIKNNADSNAKTSSILSSSSNRTIDAAGLKAPGGFNLLNNRSNPIGTAGNVRPATSLAPRGGSAAIRGKIGEQERNAKNEVASRASDVSKEEVKDRPKVVVTWVGEGAKRDGNVVIGGGARREEETRATSSEEEEESDDDEDEEEEEREQKEESDDEDQEDEDEDAERRSGSDEDEESTTEEEEEEEDSDQEDSRSRRNAPIASTSPRTPQLQSQQPRRDVPFQSSKPIATSPLLRRAAGFGNIRGQLSKADSEDGDIELSDGEEEDTGSDDEDGKEKEKKGLKKGSEEQRRQATPMKIHCFGRSRLRARAVVPQRPEPTTGVQHQQIPINSNLPGSSPRPTAKIEASSNAGTSTSPTIARQSPRSGAAASSTPPQPASSNAVSTSVTKTEIPNPQGLNWGVALEPNNSERCLRCRVCCMFKVAVPNGKPHSCRPDLIGHAWAACPSNNLRAHISEQFQSKMSIPGPSGRAGNRRSLTSPVMLLPRAISTPEVIRVIPPSTANNNSRNQPPSSSALPTSLSTLSTPSSTSSSSISPYTTEAPPHLYESMPLRLSVKASEQDGSMGDRPRTGGQKLARSPSWYAIQRSLRQQQMKGTTTTATLAE